jgi:GDP-mannose 6-dehydrogenase
MKVAIYGLGYVGLTTAGCLTKEGHRVLGIDVSETKVKKISEGISPIKEPGLDELIARAVKEGLLQCTTKTETSLHDCDMAIVCVGTPSGADGAHNMTYIAEVSRQIASVVRPDRERPLTVLYRSTIRPGTIEELILPSFKSVLGDDTAAAVDIVYNPEFLREAVAINDYFNPPKIVIGTSDGKPRATMDELNNNIDAPTFYVRYREAEFTKFVDNSFHALKVAYANEIGRLCTQLGISAATVHKIFVSDTKLNISPYYLRPGGAFGGSCLPKDVRALQFISADIGANTPVVESLLRSNDAHKHHIFQYCTRDVPKGGRVLLLGLAFKADSDDLRESPNVDLTRKLLQAGYKVYVYDPSLRPRDLIGQNLGYAYSHLPSLSDILLSKEQIGDHKFDVVIDSNRISKTLSFGECRIVNIDAFP